MNLKDHIIALYKGFPVHFIAGGAFLVGLILGGILF